MDKDTRLVTLPTDPDEVEAARMFAHREAAARAQACYTWPKLKIRELKKNEAKKIWEKKVQKPGFLSRLRRHS